MINYDLKRSIVLIDRAKTRLGHQRIVVARLGLRSDPRHIDIVQDMYSVMERNLNDLLARHAELERAGELGQLL